MGVLGATAYLYSFGNRCGPWIGTSFLKRNLKALQKSYRFGTSHSLKRPVIQCGFDEVKPIFKKEHDIRKYKRCYQ